MTARGYRSYGETMVPPFLPGAGPGAVATGPSGGGMGGPNVGGSGNGPIVRFLPDQEPIPTSQQVNTFGQATSTVAETGIEITGAQLVLPSGIIARIASVSFYVTNLLDTSILSFTVTINNAPVQGFSNVGIFPGVASRVSVGFDCYILTPSGATVEVFYTNGDGGSYIVGAALSGWQWSEADGVRWITSGT